MPLAELREMYLAYKDKISLEFVDDDEYPYFIAVDDGVGIVSITIAAERTENARDFIERIAEQRAPGYDIMIRFV